MLVLISLSFCVMVLFALAMTKHREQALSGDVSNLVIGLFRPLAWITLSFTVYISVQMFGWSIGLSVLFGALMLAALMVILLLTYHVKIILHIAILCSIFASNIVTYIRSYFY